MHHVALAFAGRSDDPLSHDLVNNMRLAGVVQRLACRIEGIAHEFCNGVVKDARRNERKYDATRNPRNARKIQCRTLRPTHRAGD